ncbi:hypothetical protein GCM10027515_07380 [Schumannella luteola]|uniref:BMP family ABC transporter substrate-binding protein n=1 Tax=Schumannella luteola TaxID=472059 RepID=A0A852Y8D6_9MICO|nr:hypothetical protein [Schumannella luteola]
MPARSPLGAALARTTVAVGGLAVVALVAGLAGCAGDDWGRPHAAPSAIGELGAGFLPSASPSPEATIHPREGSWDSVHPSPGMRVVLLKTDDEDATVATIDDSVVRWAEAEKASLRTVTAGHDKVAAIVEAMEQKPDLIISAGNDLVDALALVTANHLDQQFLVIGAEVAEPTGNVTAVDWTGASFRGEGLGTPSNYDPKSFTSARCDRAVRAGVAAVLHEARGIVVWID